MAYSVSNPPALLAHGLTNTSQPRLWVLYGTDATTVVDTNGYISNAGTLGMRKGDLVMYVKTDAAPISMQLMIVSAISTTYPYPADLSDGLAVTATNTD